MPDAQVNPNRCPQCGLHYPPDVFVCPDCRVILENPPPPKQTPAWLLALLITIITALAVYAGILAFQVFAQHHY